MITGANAGIGKETAKQLAQIKGIKKIILACRNKKKAEFAKQSLQRETGRSIFEVIVLDTTDLNSVRNTVALINEPIDGLVMNAGGAGGADFYKLTEQGVMQQFAVNVLGHALLAEELVKVGKLTQVAVFAGSEAARGVEEMGMLKPDLKTASVEAFTSIINGQSFEVLNDSQIPYGSVKLIGALWMSAMAKQYSGVRFVTMSPGGTKGTNALNSLPVGKKLMFKAMLSVMSWLGKVHTVEVGAKRFVDALTDHRYETGVFYGSEKGISGKLSDQSMHFSELSNVKYQQNAYQAIQQFLDKAEIGA